MFTGTASGKARPAWIVVLSLSAALLAPARAGAQDAGSAHQGTDVRSLDKSFRALGEQLIPATVLVKSTLGDGTGRTGYGSGAIISRDGYVITCAHVVDIASAVAVTLADGRSFDAHILGRNRKQDYALLKIDAQDLTFFTFGDSTKVALGDWVVALGHPGGPYPDLRPALSVGRVTGLHRRLPVQAMDRFYDDAIRTDAPIFAGNSGGPLVDLDGKLVGLNGAILLINEHSYAVPINEISSHMAQLRAGEEIAGRSGNAMFGAMDEFEGDDLAKFMGKAGRKLLGKDGLGKLFRGKGDTGDEVARALDRFGKQLEEKDFQKTLRDLAKNLADQNHTGNPDESGQQPGIEDVLKNLGDLFGEGPKDENPPRAREERPTPSHGWLGVNGAPENGSARGVAVGSVVPGSPADRAGIEAGDVVRAIEGYPVRTGADLAQLLGTHHPGDRVRLHLGRAVVEDGVPIDTELDAVVTLGERRE